MSRKNYLSIFLLFFIFTSSLFASSWIILFGSKDCSDCEEVKTGWSEDFELGSKPSLVFLEIENLDNYRLLSKIEKQLRIEEPAASFPVFLIGRHLLSDIDEFYGLEDQYQSLTEGATIELPELQVLSEFVQNNPAPVLVWNAPPETEERATALSKDRAAETNFHLLYFMQRGCRNCSRQRHELLRLTKLLPNLQVDCYDIGTEAGQLMLQRARQKFQTSLDDKNVTPMLAWQNGYIAHRTVTAEELLDIMQETSDDTPFWKEKISLRERRALQASQGQFLQRATVTVIAMAGLIDGINPCAFATSIFLISYLLYLKRQARQIMLIGVCFCLGVFISYLLFGLGFSFLIDFLEHLYWLKTALYLLFAALAAVFAILHLRDALRFRDSGKSSDMDMGLSLDTHRKIHTYIKRFTQVNSWLLIPAALLLGAIVSSLELACTGQIYLPALMAINATGVHWRAFYLLLLYNFFFVVPLLVVTALAAYGVGAQRIAKWAKNNVFATKICMTILFTCLTLLMAVMAWREIPSLQEPHGVSSAIDCLGKNNDVQY
ncbi:MAG: hypothetical protein GX946_08685 [Oligosphaeraceae bacterium]|nr:hypothetical protein [Oligosphaeraceae bacterium]